MGNPDSELSVVYVDDAEIEALNKKYFNRSGPTNVIAFPMREGAFSDITPLLLGDVVISTETASREALNSGISVEIRLEQLLVHGVLHLFGFDHESNQVEGRKMAVKAAELLTLIENLDE